MFDIDSVGLLALLSDMNEGLPDARKPDVRLDRTDFFLGCVVTNHKRHEREVMPQYFKLRKKVDAGARFVINQIGWHVRKDDELLRFVRREQLPVSVLANVYLLSRTAARVFHRGAIPGVVVTDELLEVAEREGASPDKGREFFVDLAAKHVAIARGLGFAGVYLGGHTPAATFGEILERSQAYAGDDWRGLAREIMFAFPDEFHLFEADPETGLSSDEVSASYLESKRRRRTDLRVPVKYRFSRRLHDAVFAEEAPLRPAGRAVYGAVDRGPRPVAKALHVLEQAAKVPLFGCRDCGDCSLPDIAYVCPESQCAKNQRNGPCGGTREGLCEVYDTECIWSQAYERLKAYGEEESMLDGPVVVKDNALAGTSAWANSVPRARPSRPRAGSEAGGLEALERAPDEHLGEVRPVLAAAADVRRRSGSLVRARRGLRRRGAAGERLLDAARAERRRAHARQAHLDAAVDLRGGDADGRPVGRAPHVLQVRPGGASSARGSRSASRRGRARSRTCR